MQRHAAAPPGSSIPCVSPNHGSAQRQQSAAFRAFAQSARDIVTSVGSESSLAGPGFSIAPPVKSQLTSAKKTDPETRKRIRSHVMLGKNRGKNPNSKPRGRAASVAVAGSDVRRLSTNWSLTDIPPRVGSDLGFVSFHLKIDAQAVTEAMKFVFAFAKTRYILGNYLIFEELSAAWLEQLALDAPFLQSVILAAQICLEAMGAPRNYSSTNRQNVLKTLQLLRERLSLEAEEAQLSDTTIFVVVNLAIHARVSGEDQSVKQHLEGIRKIVNLRGGIGKLWEPKLLVEIFRCDLGMSLHTGTTPLFYHDVQGSGAFLSYPDEMGLQGEMDTDLAGLDRDVAKAWKVTRSFCSFINLASEAQGRLPWKLFLKTMSSLMYRLIDMRFSNDSLNEAVRLGILAFCSHVFLRWKSVAMPYDHLAEFFKNCLHRLESSNIVSPRVFSWLLMTGAVSVFKQPEDSWLIPRLRANIEACGAKSWKGMRDILESLVWIHVVQEIPGQDIFDSVFCQ